MNCQVAPFVFNMIQENTYLLAGNDGKAAIIDCGCSTPAEQQVLADRIRQWELSVELILLTHLHFDHIWGLPWAVQTYPYAKVYAHPTELEHAQSPREQMSAWGLGTASFAYDLNDITPLPADRPVYLGSLPIYDLFVPGHTAGHAAYYVPTDNIVFTGDVLFRGDIGRSDLPGGNYDTLIRSIKNQLLTLPDETIIYPGHGPSSTIFIERNNNPYIN